jgi:hypothetical protein
MKKQILHNMFYFDFNLNFCFIIYNFFYVNYYSILLFLDILLDKKFFLYYY